MVIPLTMYTLKHSESACNLNVLNAFFFCDVIASFTSLISSPLYFLHPILRNFHFAIFCSKLKDGRPARIHVVSRNCENMDRRKCQVDNE